MYVILVQVEGEEPEVHDEAADHCVLANELISELLHEAAEGKVLAAPGQLLHDHDTMIGEFHFIGDPSIKFTAIAIESIRT